VVDLSAHPSVLGRLLSSSPSPESRVSLLVELPDLPSTFPGSSPGNFLALFPGKFPGVFPGGRQAGSRSCCTHHTKGVIL
jgi:hypothetical protein